MGAWVMIELKNKSDQNILAKNNILKEKGSELFFVTENDHQNEYEYYKKNPQDYPSHLFVKGMTKKAFITRWTHFWSSNKVGWMGFDVYFNRTSKEQMQIVKELLEMFPDDIVIRSCEESFYQKVNS